MLSTDSMRKQEWYAILSSRKVKEIVTDKDLCFPELRIIHKKMHDMEGHEKTGLNLSGRLLSGKKEKG